MRLIEEIFHLIRALKYPSIFSDMASRLITKKTVLVVESNSNSFQNKDQCLKLVVDVMIEEKFKALIMENETRLTRIYSDNCKIILNAVKNKPSKRLEIEGFFKIVAQLRTKLRAIFQVLLSTANVSLLFVTFF